MTENAPKLRWFQFRLRTLLVAVLVLSLPLSWFTVRMERRRRQQNVVATIDSSVPGTEVYYRASLLGETPLEVTRTMCKEHGFKIPDDLLIFDGWGEGICFGTEDEDESKIMFLVPQRERDRYLTIDTPWGERTKQRSVAYHNESELKTDFLPLVDDDGIRLELKPIETARPSTELTMSLTLSGTGEQEVTGCRPELMALWGSFDTPWRHRSCSRMSLDERFSSIAPGDTLDVTMPIKAPDVASDYSVFVVFYLFKDETGHRLKISAVNSESRHLRVRR